MDPDRGTPAQRVGAFLAFVEGCLLGFVAALHFGWTAHLGRATFGAPFLYPAGIVEAVLALGLILGVVLPGAGTVRAGRVLAAQILVVIGLFATQVAFMRGAALMTGRNEIFYGVVLALALSSIVLVASPAYRSRPVAR